MNYSLGLQLITSPSLKIWDYVLGATGSTHDSEAFKKSYTYANHETLFPHGQWLWADSAYALLDWCITPYKEPEASERLNKQFNYHLSRVRIRSEHAVGALKGRFQCLKGLCVRINSENNLLLALEMVRSCLIVHNLILEVEQIPDDIVEWEWGLNGLDEDAEGMAEPVDGFEWDGEVLGDFEPGTPREKRARIQAVLLRELYAM